MCFKFQDVDLEQVAKNRMDSFDMGFEEPRFLTTNASDLKTRRVIPNPTNFLYNRQNMEGAPNIDHASLASDIGNIINQHAGTMTPELRQVMQGVLAKHKIGRASCRERV